MIRASTVRRPSKQKEKKCSSRSICPHGGHFQSRLNDGILIALHIGRSFAIVSTNDAKPGFIDIDEDDRVDRDKFLTNFQDNVIRLRGDDWN